MAGKTGKKKGEGKKKGAGQRKKKTGPEMTWKEALLAYEYVYLSHLLPLVTTF